MNPRYLFQIVYTETDQDRQQVSQGCEFGAPDTLDWSLRLSALTAIVLGGLYDLAVALMDRRKHEPLQSMPSPTPIGKDDKFTASTIIPQASKANN